VNGDWLTPRQELVPVPYALSLRPGAEIQADASTNWVFRVGNTSSVATGSAIWGNAATGSAVYGNSSGGYGVRAYSSAGNALQATSHKTAGVLSSTEGYGIRVTSYGTNHWDHGGYFLANMGYGVYAESTQNYGLVATGGTVGIRGNGDFAPDGRRSSAGLEVTLEGPVPAGEYLLLVVQGPARVKASALSSPIQPGDLLSSAAEAGYAAKAAQVTVEGVPLALPGTIFGKALEALDADRDLIYVFVTLQ
jgi:hypothetical protein